MRARREAGIPPRREPDPNELSSDQERTGGHMARSMLQRRLVDVSERLKRLRMELQVTTEQLAYLEEEAEEARLRALVSETPLGDVEARDARRHADVLARHRDALALQVSQLQREQDELLDRMSSELSAR